MMSPDQLNHLLAQLLSAVQQSLGAQQATATSTAPASVGGSRLSAKHFRSDAFSGDPSTWDDWSFAFKRCVRSLHKGTYQLMVEWEAKEDEVDEATEITEEMEQRSAELYDVLCQFCTGEALMVVRSASDMEGITAWQKLFKKYNPRTMARGLRMLSEVVNPPKAKDLSDVEMAVTRWEEKVKRLACQFEENLTDRMKIAIFTNLMPNAIQDYIYTHADKETKYEELREKVRAMVSNKVSRSMGPTPMDIGDVGGQQGEHWHEPEEDWKREEEHQVDGVASHYRCRNCEGYGHFARECPSKGLQKGGKGFGKTGKGKGVGDNAVGWTTKGKGLVKGDKGSGKAAANGDMGKSRGFSGTCWTCGKAGHRANECRSSGANCVQEWTEENQADQEVVNMGGVWGVAHVAVKTHNRYAVLAEDGGEAEEEERRRCCGAGVDLPYASLDARVSVEEAPVQEVREERSDWTRLSSMLFNVAGVTKPLASAAKVVEAGNRVVLDPQSSYIENIQTREKMALRKDQGVFVFDVKYEDGGMGVITLDSGAGVSVWPKGWKPHIKVEPKKPGLKMVAANGTEIENIGQKRVLFRGVHGGEASVFGGQSR